MVPANEVSWDDFRAVVGAARCFDALCFCQRFKILKGWHQVGEEERAHRLRAQAECGTPESDATSGLVGEPGKTITWGELHVGSRNAFGAAGFREVTRPTKRRVVMRIDL
jgi:hypothetical protein